MKLLILLGLIGVCLATTPLAFENFDVFGDYDQLDIQDFDEVDLFGDEFSRKMFNVQKDLRNAEAQLNWCRSKVEIAIRTKNLTSRERITQQIDVILTKLKNVEKTVAEEKAKDHSEQEKALLDKANAKAAELIQKYDSLKKRLETNTIFLDARFDQFKKNVTRDLDDIKQVKKTIEPQVNRAVQTRNVTMKRQLNATCDVQLQRLNKLGQAVAQEKNKDHSMMEKYWLSRTSTSINDLTKDFNKMKSQMRQVFFDFFEFLDLRFDQFKNNVTKVLNEIREQKKIIKPKVDNATGSGNNNLKKQLNSTIDVQLKRLDILQMNITKEKNDNGKSHGMLQKRWISSTESSIKDHRKDFEKMKSKLRASFFAEIEFLDQRFDSFKNNMTKALSDIKSDKKTIKAQVDEAISKNNVTMKKNLNATIDVQLKKLDVLAQNITQEETNNGKNHGMLQKRWISSTKQSIKDHRKDFMKLKERLRLHSLVNRAFDFFDLRFEQFKSNVTKCLKMCRDQKSIISKKIDLAIKTRNNTMKKELNATVDHHIKMLIELSRNLTIENRTREHTLEERKWISSTNRSVTNLKFDYIYMKTRLRPSFFAFFFIETLDQKFDQFKANVTRDLEEIKKKKKELDPQVNQAIKVKNITGMRQLNASCDVQLKKLNGLFIAVQAEKKRTDHGVMEKYWLSRTTTAINDLEKDFNKMKNKMRGSFFADDFLDARFDEFKNKTQKALHDIKDKKHELKHKVKEAEKQLNNTIRKELNATIDVELKKLDQLQKDLELEKATKKHTVEQEKWIIKTNHSINDIRHKLREMKHHLQPVKGLTGDDVELFDDLEKINEKLEKIKNGVHEIKKKYDEYKKEKKEETKKNLLEQIAQERKNLKQLDEEIEKAQKKEENPIKIALLAKAKYEVKKMDEALEKIEKQIQEDK